MGGFIARDRSLNTSPTHQGSSKAPRRAAWRLIHQSKHPLIITSRDHNSWTQGRRPKTELEKPLGFDLYDVWAGKVRAPNGIVLGFGVGGLPESERMPVLDVTGENEEIFRIS